MEHIFSSHKKGFTLVELLIVIAILATIVAITVLILNPVEYLKRGRDAQRLRDYTLINQSVNFYSYGASVQFQDPDFDGPNYTESCVGEDEQRIFVSVPSDNGESDPDASSTPDGWTYNRVSSTPLRAIDGSGWLPLDFSTINESLRPLNILPVDPVNTFEDGYYYTYTCGSYELNLRFETEKYATLAANDGGDDPLVYELGSNLRTAPEQERYRVNAVSGGGSVTNPTKVTLSSPADGSVVTGGSALLTWDDGDNDADYYSVYEGLSAGSLQLEVASTTTQSYTLLNIDDGLDHYWRVDSHTNAGGYTMGDVWRFTGASTTNATSGTAVLLPDGEYHNSGGWVAINASSTWEAINDPTNSGQGTITSDYIRVNATNEQINFTLSDDTTIPSGATITEVRMVATHKQTFSDETIIPQIRVGTSSYLTDAAFMPGGGWNSSPAVVGTWSAPAITATDIDLLQAGFSSQAVGGWAGETQIAQMYIEIDWTN